MSQWWSWVLTIIGVVTMYLAGKKNKLGWAIGLVGQVLWLAYSITTKQYGFIVSSFAYGWVYAHNWRKWNKEGEEDGRTRARTEPI